MSAFSSICDYGTDSEDSETELQKPSKSKLPLPSLNGVRTISEDKHEDNPQLHNGRVRHFAHVRGNWPTFVYLQYSKVDSIKTIIEQLASASETVGSIELTKDFHVSLSRTVVLKYHMISTFNASLKAALKPLSRFFLEFDSIKVYCNDNKSRTFVALTVDHVSQNHLIQFVKKVDEVLNEFQLPEFYENPSFHLSVLWTHGDKVKDLEQALKALISFKTEAILVDKVNCKIGNKYYQYFLD